MREVQQLAQSHFGVSGEFTALDGERDQNHRIRTEDGRQFVFKISGFNEPMDVVEMQVLALRHIEQNDPGLPVPRMIASLNGEYIRKAETSEGPHAIRLLSWLPGMLYQDGIFPSAQGLQDLGGFVARLGLALSDFEHPAAGHFMPWNIANGLVFSKQLRALMPAGLSGWLPAYFERLEHSVFPALAKQRHQVIHQDAHGANLLRASPESETVSGVIDFGDIIYGPLICDLVACASDLMEAGPDPTFAAAEMCRGYHRIKPLLDNELELMLDLVMVRQIMRLQLFEFRRLNMANPPDFVINDQEGAIACLQGLVKLDAQDFVQQLRNAVREVERNE
jgi:Ser/Thr protein kinase RdoA (MazF antagonist)